MPLRIGSVTVRRAPQRYRVADSGVLVPEAFRGDVEAFSDWYAQLWTGRRLRRSGRLLWAEGVPPMSMHPEQVWAREYADACRELDQSIAGEKAREMLFDFLLPSQREQAIRYRYFDVGIYNPYLAQACLEAGLPVELNTAKFRFHRGFPNGNIEGFTRKGRYTLCLHPTTPYPTDDIILGQVAMLLLDPNDFIRKANFTPVGNSPALKPTLMFKEYPQDRRTDLVLPHLKRSPAPDNIPVGQE